MAAKRKKTTRQKSSLPDDPATRYAVAVQSGSIVAGPHVRLACKRHIDDLKNGHKRGLRWDVEAVGRVVRFFEKVLTVEVETIDPETMETLSDAVPFILDPHQCFIIGSLFGWRNSLGYRRFRRAFVEMAKGNGKSPLAAGIGHYMLVAQDKLRAEIYSAATDKDQAAILFRDAVAMWQRSPALHSRLNSSGVNPVWQLTYLKLGSFFKPISSEKKGKSGARPYCALIDEVHEHPNNSVIEMLRAGTKGNREALLFEITNSGFDRNSVCWNEHKYSIDVLEGTVENDAWFAYVCALDEDDDPFEDEACWIKANPNLGVSIQSEYIREQVEEARGMPSKQSLVRRLHFCQWTDAAETWITRKVWETIEDDIDIGSYAGEQCFAALDMSFTQDLTALSAVFPTAANEFDAFVYFWTPAETMDARSARDGVDYRNWADREFIFATDGKVIKLQDVARQIAWLMETFDLQMLAYDRYRHKDLDEKLSDLGIQPPLREHPQGFRRGGKLEDENGDPILDAEGKQLDNPLWMPSSFDALEEGVIEARIRVPANPVLRWNVASAVVRDDPAGTGNRIFDKRKATGRIDGVVALAMGVGAASAGSIGRKRRSVYEDSNVFV